MPPSSVLLLDLTSLAKPAGGVDRNNASPGSDQNPPLRLNAKTPRRQDARVRSSVNRASDHHLGEASRADPSRELFAPLRLCAFALKSCWWIEEAGMADGIREDYGPERGVIFFPAAAGQFRTQGRNHGDTETRMWLMLLHNLRVSVPPWLFRCSAETGL